MCVFALITGGMQPDDLGTFLRGRPMTSDEGVEALIAWLRDNSDPTPQG